MENKRNKSQVSKVILFKLRVGKANSGLTIRKFTVITPFNIKKKKKV